ncbi:hybrid sensor histidine kinase/response regulator [Robbsia betulipollinis]|nr:ATP-binding protein [Robbsia betulipollinis]
MSRLTALGILDSPAEASFDRLVELAAHVMNASVASIDFIDDHRVWCKAAWGRPRGETPRAKSLCDETLRRGTRLVLADAREDAAFSQCREVIDERRVVFYAGIVLRGTDGVALGALSVTDQTPRRIDENGISALELIAGQVTELLESRRLNQENLQQKSQIDQVQENRDRFLAMLAHELRAPLAPILTAAQVLNAQTATADQQQWSRQTILRHATHMGEVIQHLLSASLVASGAVDLKLQPVSVAALLQSAYEMSESAIREQQHIYYPADTAEWVMADPAQLVVVLVDLLKNAARYTPARGRIHARVDVAGDWVNIRISDNGAGIASHDIDEIFQVFGQSRQPLDRAKGGIGLGLALGRRIAEWHGGTLTAYSRGPEQGSEFTLTLARATPEAPQRVPVRDEGWASLSPPLEILVIDDNVDTAEALAMYYQSLGQRVRLAHNAKDALAAMDRWHPDVVLSDIGLPDISGYELAKRLSRNDTLVETLLIAISGYADARARAASKAAGFHAHFGKPVDLPVMDRLIVNHFLQSDS